MTFKSESQVGQDAFAYRLLIEPTGFLTGRFLDIGCGHPTERNNTVALERLGWTGILMDNNEFCVDECRRVRNPSTRVIKANVAAFDFTSISSERFDYMSLDVDSYSLATLKNALSGGINFRAATIEHDAYAYPEGNDPRDEMRSLFRQFGYQLLCPDVADLQDPSNPQSRRLVFEDWWVDPARVDMNVAERFRAVSGSLGREISKP